PLFEESSHLEAPGRYRVVVVGTTGLLFHSEFARSMFLVRKLACGAALGQTAQSPLRLSIHSATTRSPHSKIEITSTAASGKNSRHFSKNSVKRPLSVKSGPVVVECKIVGKLIHSL